MSITIQKAAENLEVSRTTIYNHIKKFNDKEKAKFLITEKNSRKLTKEGLEFIKKGLAPGFKVDTDVLEEKDVYIAELEEKLSERDYELQNLHKEQSEQLSIMARLHSEQLATLTTLLSNQQALTLQAQTTKEKQPLLARIFGTKKRADE